VFGGDFCSLYRWQLNVLSVHVEISVYQNAAASKRCGVDALVEAALVFKHLEVRFPQSELSPVFLGFHVKRFGAHSHDEVLHLSPRDRIVHAKAC